VWLLLAREGLNSHSVVDARLPNIESNGGRFCLGGRQRKGRTTTPRLQLRDCGSTKSPDLEHMRWQPGRYRLHREHVMAQWCAAHQPGRELEGLFMQVVRKGVIDGAVMHQPVI
jgi:hypothetical protein